MIERGPLDDDALRRYARQIALPELGPEGQARLARARVMIVGAGGLGCPAALYLTAAGVGTIGLMDDDRVDASNLQRQVLFTERDVGRSKVEAARERLTALERHVHVVPIASRLTADNALQSLADWDVVIDGVDTFATRYVINDACVRLGTPNVHGSVLRFEGRVTVLCTDDAPCYRCMFHEAPPPGTVPSCAEAGVLGVLPGLVGVLQATEAIKLITGIGETLQGRLLLIDVLRARWQTVMVARDPGCVACGTRTLSQIGLGLDDECEETDTMQSESDSIEIDPATLARRLRAGEALDVIDVREEWEHRIASLPTARLIPMGRLGAAIDTIDPDREVVVVCHHGVRSAAVAQALRRAGIRRAVSLAGGLDAWSTQIDPALPRY